MRVLELALLAPDLLGMHLADLGAEVIKRGVAGAEPWRAHTEEILTSVLGLGPEAIDKLRASGVV